MLLLAVRGRDGEINLASIATAVENTQRLKVVNMILRYKDTERDCMYLDCVTKDAVDKKLAELKDNGYSDGAQSDEDVMVKEGEKITLALSGDVAFDDNPDDISFIYNSMTNNAGMEVYIVDIGQQPGLYSYGKLKYTGNKEEEDNILCNLSVRLLKQKPILTPAGKLQNA